MKRILLVEDDENFVFGIEYTLTNEGYEVVHAGSLKEARAALAQTEVDIILLDINLPDGTGYELCRDIRMDSQVPIIFLTALDEETNVVAGLDLGADDYMTKPIRTKELLSRIKAVLRRHPHPEQKSNIWRSGEFEVRVLEGAVLKNKKEVLLTSMEFRLLLMLMSNPKQICSRTSILEKLWDVSGEFIDDNTLSVHIRRLREKVEQTPAAPQYIVTIRGVGYKWNAETTGVYS
ncbi:MULTISPECIES: response regulator transcription factor [unclassified Paenibacillus]|uniref:response regulator transcription factor n=1 Tax=unclassified Paenibacillus TaxID=185978 RepID=UPI0008D29BD0|nr:MULTISPECIES: response regulator transcription factor [unclassified Paenibacillus]QLG40732.1 response regulator transcription factor [Paenibacillus sp. E222]SEN58495.1 DNA-binding response regulator, OmpR family, contains REC and winged-helix (wHTH) domain [Paenibacillus sp. OK076]